MSFVRNDQGYFIEVPPEPPEQSPSLGRQLLSEVIWTKTTLKLGAVAFSGYLAWEMSDAWHFGVIGSVAAYIFLFQGEGSGGGGGGSAVGGDSGGCG